MPKWAKVFLLILLILYIVWCLLIGGVIVWFAFAESHHQIRDAAAVLAVCAALITLAGSLRRKRLAFKIGIGLGILHFFCVGTYVMAIPKGIDPIAFLPILYFDFPVLWPILMVASFVNLVFLFQGWFWDLVGAAVWLIPGTVWFFFLPTIIVWLVNGTRGNRQNLTR